MFRTYKKEALAHIVTTGSMILALGVTGYYFQYPGSSHIPPLLSGALLFPLYLVQMYIGGNFEELVIGNPTLTFLLLWCSYSVLCIWLTPLLLIRRHTAEELRKWYDNRLSGR